MKLASLLVVAACGAPSQPAPAPAVPAPALPAPAAPAPAVPAPAAPAHGPIVWSIDCAPSTVTMAQRASILITIRATNTTTAARDPERDPLDVLVDGTSSMELSMAFGNGGRDRAWSAIPPGATVTDERTGMDVVDAPGDHVIAIVHDGVLLARTTLHVTP